MSWLDTLEDIRKKDFSTCTDAERDKAARDVVNMSSYGCAVIAVSPMPFSDALLMLPLQSGMVMTVGHIYGRKVTRAAASELIVELGAGWLGLAIALARKYPKAHVVAVERAWVPWCFSRVRLLVSSVPNLEVRRVDVRDVDVSHASLVTTYLWTGGMTLLEPKLRAALPEGAQVISLTFGFTSWPVDEERLVNDLYRSPVRRYVQRRSGRDGEGGVAVP